MCHKGPTGGGGGEGKPKIFPQKQENYKIISQKVCQKGKMEGCFLMTLN